MLDAIHFATEHHRTQRRKGRATGDVGLDTPYINHPIRVAQLLAGIGGVRDLDVLLAAVLHDTVEDTTATSKDIDDRFGPHVAALVAEVTDDKGLPKAERKQLQVEHAPSMTPGAALVKLADKIDNITDLLVSPPEWPIERVREYFDWAGRVVTGLPVQNEPLMKHFSDLMAQKP
jgi:guanosine-3',5'-bis(diphosphate) 3'-pyrophosphohydrolase